MVCTLQLPELITVVGSTNMDVKKLSTVYTTFICDNK